MNWMCHRRADETTVSRPPDIGDFRFSIDVAFEFGSVVAFDLQRIGGTDFDTRVVWTNLKE